MARGVHNALFARRNCRGLWPPAYIAFGGYGPLAWALHGIFWGLWAMACGPQVVGTRLAVLVKCSVVGGCEPLARALHMGAVAPCKICAWGLVPPAKFARKFFPY